MNSQQYNDDHIPEDEKALIYKGNSLAEGCGRLRNLKILKCNHDFLYLRLPKLKGEAIDRCLWSIDNLARQIEEMEA